MRSECRLRGDLATLFGSRLTYFSMDSFFWLPIGIFGTGQPHERFTIQLVLLSLFCAQYVH